MSTNTQLDPPGGALGAPYAGAGAGAPGYAAHAKQRRTNFEPVYY